MNVCLVLIVLFMCAKAKLYSYMYQSLLRKCPNYQMHFQKVIGFRPIENDAYVKITLVHPSKDSWSPINYECWKKCQQNSECIGYILLIRNNQCFGYGYQSNSALHVRPIDTGMDLVPDPDSIFFEKICLNVPENCKSKLWAIVKIPGSSLVFQGKKTLPTLVTRRDCAQKCLFESDFQCLSAAFSPSYKNNYARTYTIHKRNEVLGQCTLSMKDKIVQPDAFRTGTLQEYIENDCIDRPIEQESCSYEMYSNSTFLYSEIKYNQISQKECQYKCSHETRFYCQGISYSLKSSYDSECLLHSEDLISMGPRNLVAAPNFVYMRRVKCLNISVTCTDNEMIINYTPVDYFRGKIYVSFHSNECSAQGNGTNPTMLRLAIGNEITESRCGILRAYEMSEAHRRTFISTLIVMQNNPNVQAQGDRLIKVGCIFYNGSSDGSTNMDQSSTMAFTQPEPSSNVSAPINGLTNFPRVFMKIIDLSKQVSTNNVQIGQTLELRIISIPVNSAYDFQGVSLKAYGEASDSVTLIDDRGCPTDATIFPPFEKYTEDNKKYLRTKFNAFKFAGTQLVNFNVKIHFCLKVCAPVNCTDDFHLNNKRMKRNLDTGVQDVLTEATSAVVMVKYPLAFSTIQSSDSTNVNASLATAGSYFSKLADINFEVSLNLKLNVYGPYLTEPNSLIYGENGQILVSGVDVIKSEVICIDRSLLIAICVFWTIFQIILMVCCYCLVRKYKRWIRYDDDACSLHQTRESLDYTDDSNRRVHWADQGSTLI